MKSRPARCGMPIVLKKFGVTGLHVGAGHARPAAGVGWSSAIEAGADAEAGHRQEAHAGGALHARDRADASSTASV